MKTQPMLAALILLCAASSAPAADDATVTAVITKAPGATDYPEAGAIVLMDETVITLDSAGTVSRHGHTLIKILQDRARDEMSDRKVRFNGKTETCTVLKALTHSVSGATQEPEADGIMEVSDPEAARAPFYSNARLKVVSFPKVELGAVLELEYRIDPLEGMTGEEGDKFLADEVLFGGDEPVLSRSLTVQVPSDTPLQYRMFNSSVEPEITSSGGHVTYQWHLENQPQIVREPGSVPMGELVPRLVFTDARDIEQVGSWLAGLFDRQAEPSASITAEVEELTAGYAEPGDKLDAVALFVVKEIRNVNLELGRVGYDPTPADRILANKYADVRDKFTLFKAMVRALGLDAEPVLVHTSHTAFADIPCLHQFDDILARVVLPGGRTRLVCLSDNRLRYGLLAPEDAGMPALVARPQGSELIQTPEVDESTNTLRATWTVTLDPQGTLSGSVTSRFDGAFDGQVRRQFFWKNAEERDIFMHDVVDGVKKGAVLDHFEVSDTFDLRQPSSVSFSFSVPSFALVQGDMMLVNLPTDRTPIGNTAFSPVLPVVKYPCQIPYSFQEVTCIDLTLPEGYRVSYVPPPSTMDRERFERRITSTTEGRIVHLEETTTWHEGVISVADYPAVWEAYVQTQAPGTDLILLERND